MPQGRCVAAPTAPTALGAMPWQRCSPWGHRRAGKECTDHPQAHILAFFRVKLHPDHRVSADHGRDRPSIVHMGQALRRIGDAEMVGVDEIDMIAGFYPVKHRVIAIQNQIVPAHMRHLERSVRRLDPQHVPRDPIQTIGFGVFMAF